MSNTEEEWMNRTLDTSLDDTESINTVKIFDADSIDALLFSEEFIGDEEDDSNISEDLHSNDLEKSNAIVAAFTVVFIFCLFFVELALTILYVLSANTDFQSQIIAHGICKNFSMWQFMENMTESWCDPRIFNRDFKLEFQCPCFVSNMFRNMTVY